MQIKFFVPGIPAEKYCKRCDTIKPINEFCKNKSMKDGFCFYCKKCQYEMTAKWAKENPDKAYQKKLKWEKNNPEKVIAASRRRYANNPEIYKAKNKRWRDANPDKKRIYNLKWEKENPEKRKATARKTIAKKRMTAKGKLSSNMSRSVCRALKGLKGGAHWELLVGYTTEKLKKHIERQFKPGMSWSNYGKWHVDHVLPIAVFNFKKTDDIDFKRCWSLENLQPLWAAENCSKQDKLKKPFQPTFSF